MGMTSYLARKDGHFDIVQLEGYLISGLVILWFNVKVILTL